MAYDKQAIEAAQKKGILDSSLDAAALSLDDGEKARLRQRLESSRRESQAGAEREEFVVHGRQDAFQTQATEEGGGLSGLWAKIVAFFKALFADNPKEKSTNRRFLRELERHLTEFAPPVYDPKMTVVKKEFIEYLQMIQKKVEAFSEFFSANFLIGADDFVADRSPCFVRFIIESQLSLEQARALRELRTFDLQKSFSLRGEMITQRDTEIQIKKFISSFDGANLQRIEELLEFYVAVLNLKNYNFQAIFSLFQADGAHNDSFRDFSLEHCLGQFRNLDSYLAGINPNKIKEDHYLWFDRFRETLEEEENSGIPRYTSDDFRGLTGPLRKLVEKRIVTYLVRLGSEDLEYKPKPVVNTLSWVEKYRRLAESSFKDHLDRNIIILREEQTGSQIEELFEGYRPFTWLPVLNRETNENLKRAKGPEFESAFLFNLVWNYLDRIYIDRFKRSVNSIVVEGEFRKKDVGTDFANTYYALDECYERMKESCERMAVNSSLAIRINNFTEGKMENLIASKKFESDLEEFDNALHELAEHGGTQLMKLSRHMDNILRDFKGMRAIDLINAKAIGGISNRNLLFVYDKLVVSLKKLESILAHFMVVRDQIPGSGPDE